MYQVRLLAPTCVHCGRGNEVLYRQEFEMAGRFVIADLDFLLMDDKPVEHCVEPIRTAIHTLVNDPKKHRQYMPIRMPYEKMIIELCSLMEAMNDHPRSIFRAAEEMPF